MVSSVSKESYEVLGDEHINALFEPGLQAWGEIIAFKTAIDWLKKQKKTSRVDEFSKDIFEFLKEKAGEKRGEYFMRSLKNVREKTLKY